MREPVEPNRLTAPGERAASARIDELFRRVDALSAEQLAMLALPQRDIQDRETRLDEAERLADRLGRGELLDRSRRRIRDLLLTRATEVWPRSGLAGGMILSSGRVEDRVAVIAAIEDAVAVAVVADAMKPDDAWALAGPGMQLLGVPPTDLPSAAQLEPTALADGEDASRTKRADGTADDGDAGLAAELEAEEEARASLRQRRAAVFVIVAAIAVPAALTLDIGLIGLVLVVLALALLAWLFA